MNNYHDYVIKDGRFIGQFEQMYRDCENPWNEKGEYYDGSPCDVATKQLIRAQADPTTCSLGDGLGRFLDWVNVAGCGVEISATAHTLAKTMYPWLEFVNNDILAAMATHTEPFATYLFREVLWYILPDWQKICDILATKHGALVIVELSFYDEQHYGKDYFDGPDDFITKWPFSIEKIVREHTTKHQREGRIMVAGRVP